MASIAGIGIFLIILVVAFAVFGSQISEIMTSLSNTVQGQNLNYNLQINPTNGQQVCNLKIVFTPTLVALPAVGQSINTAVLGVVAGWQLDGAQYSWSYCHQYGNPLQMSWVPFSWIDIQPGNNTSNIPEFATNDILLSAGQTVHLDLTIVAPDGGIRSYTGDPFCSQLCSSISIPAGAVFVPKQYTFTFAITNLPKQDYQIDVTSELGFNGGNAGSQYVQEING